MRATKFFAAGERKLLKVTANVGAPRLIPITKNDIWH